MIDKKFWDKITNEQAEFDKSRRIIAAQAGEALHKSKQAIFAIHRDNLPEAETTLGEAEDILKQLEKDYAKNKKLRYEGAWSAGLEEFVEAKFFLAFVKNEPIGAISSVALESSEYLGGFTDYTGELSRRAVLLAGKRKFKEVEEIVKEIEDAVHQLLEYNLTGYLRTKFDQAKRNLQKVEQVLYEINLMK